MFIIISFFSCIHQSTATRVLHRSKLYISHTQPLLLVTDVFHVKFPILLQTGICTKTNGNLLTSLRGEEWTRWWLGSCFFLYLECEEEEESHHETEKSHGFGQSETQNGIGEELLLQGRVAGIADDQRSEDAADTSTRASDSDGSSSGTNEFGCGVNVSRHSRCLDGTDGGSRDQGLFWWLRHQSTADRSQVHLWSWGQL